MLTTCTHAAGKGEGSTEPLLGGGWVGGALNLLLRTLLNATLTINSLIVKYAAGSSVATLRCGALCVVTGADDWWEQVEVGGACWPDDGITMKTNACDISALYAIG